MPAQIIRKSASLGLAFPYDWSNPDIPDDALILNVLDRGIFEDICIISAHYGIERVEAAAKTLDPDVYKYGALERKLRNIKIGFSRAET